MEVEPNVRRQGVGGKIPSPISLFLIPGIPCPSSYLSRSTDGLGLLSLVVAVFRLHLLDLGDVLLLCLLGCESVVDDLLPGVVLGLALFWGGRKGWLVGAFMVGVEGGRELALISNMPGLEALLISSPVATL